MIFRQVIKVCEMRMCCVQKCNEISQFDFRMKLIERIIEEGGCMQEPSARGYYLKSAENVARLTGRHFP